MKNEENLIHGSSVKKKEDKVSYFKLYRFSTLPDLILICIGIIGSIICGILVPYTTILFGEVLGIIVDYAGSLKQINITDKEKDVLLVKLFSKTYHGLINIGTTAFIITLCTYITSVCFAYSSSRQVLKMRTLLFGKLLDQDIRWHDQNKAESFGKMITENIVQIEDGIGERIAILIFSKTTYFVSVIWAVMMGFEFALVCVIVLPIKTLVAVLITTLSKKYCKDEVVTYRAAGAVAIEVLSSIKTVVAHGAEERESKRYGQHLKQVEYTNIKRFLIDGFNKCIYQFLEMIGYAVALWYGIGLLVKERSLPEEKRIYTTGTVLSIYFVTILASWHYCFGGTILKSFKKAKVAAFKVFNILDSEHVIHKQIDVGKIPNFTGDVMFSYAVKPTQQALQNVDIILRCGETTAFVGPPGSGKSTMVQMLQRFYDPSFGTILIDGIDLKNIQQNYVRNNIAVVSKLPSLFPTTIADNIRYGKPTATMDDIVKAAQMASVHKFISNLPCGYETAMGEIESQLNKAQKLKIAIARALIKNPLLLILDEVTALLDPADEFEVQSVLDSVNTGCTTIIISDRLSVLRKANKIIVFDNGTVIEQGSHDELIERNGTYYNMIDSGQISDRQNEDKINTPFSPFKSNEFSFISFKLDEDENNVLIEDKKNIGAKEAFTNRLKILKFTKPEWIKMTMGCIGSLIVGASAPVYGLIVGKIFGELTVINDVVNVDFYYPYLLDLLYLGIITGIAIFFQTFAFGYTGEKLKSTLRTNTFSAMLKQEIGWFDKKENSLEALVVKLVGDAAFVQLDGIAKMGVIINSFSTLFLSIGICLYVEWRLTLILGIFYPGIIFSTYDSGKHLILQADFTRKTLQKSSKIVAETIDNIKMVKALGCKNKLYESYLNELVHCRKIGLRKSLKGGLLTGSFSRSLPYLAHAAAISYGVRWLSEAEFDTSTLFMVLHVMVTSALFIGISLAALPNTRRGISGASEILALLDRVPTIRSNSSSIQHQWEIPNIQFSRILFSYPTKPTVQVLKDLDLSVKPGKTVVLVGDTDYGKSTLAELLMRFYDPQSGAISIDGQDLRNVNLHCLRSQLGVVDQKPTLFNLTIAENIGYGLNDGTATMEKIIEAAKSANIHNLITSFPLGYATILDRKVNQLTESQKRRITIARTLLKDPKILFINETALSDEVQQIVEEVLDKARQGRTCILVSSNLTTIKKADEICVLKQGRVVETGSHEKLLAKNGHYYKYYELQSKREQPK